MLRPSIRFRFRLIAPAIVAVLAVIGGLAGNLVANALDVRLRPYFFWVAVVLCISVLTTLVVLVVDALNNTTEAALNNSSLNVETGNSDASLPSSTVAVAGISLNELPTPPGDFTGRRKELDELNRKIEQDGVAICALRGLAGVGKTSLALKLAEKLTQRYPDAQLYLDLKGNSKQPLSASDAMTHVTRSLHPEADPPNSDVELGGVYRSSLHGRRVLLLMDNAFDREQVEPLIPPTSCILLVTSRQHFTLPGMLAKDIHVLPIEDACEVLLKIAPRIGADAKRMAELCGRLPLALRVAGSALTDRVDLKPADCVRMLEDNRQRLRILDRVEASLRLSYDLLNPELQALWSALSVFEVTFEISSAATVWDVKRQRASDELGELIKYSLVDWNESIGRYGLHDLVRAFADTCLGSQEREKAKKRHAAFFLNVVKDVDRLYQQGGEENTLRAIAIFDTEWSNIEAGQQWAELNSEIDRDALRLCSDYPDAASKMLALHRLPAERIAWFEAGLAAARKLNDRTSEGHHLVNLGRSYYLVDAVPERAKKLCEDGLRIAREVGDRDGEGQALGNLGVFYRESGEGRQAIGLFDERLEIAQELGDKRGEANTFGNLGRTYWTLHDLPRAIEYCNQQLALARAIGDRGNEARALGNLGQAYSVLKEFDRAIGLSRQSLAIQEQLGNRRAQGGALGELGKTYETMGDLERAKQCYQLSLDIQREVGYRKAQGNALANLGRVYKKLGDTERALECHKEHLEIARETNDSRTEGLALRNMCFVFRAREDYTQAISYAQKALDLFERIGDPLASKMGKQIDSWRERVAQQETESKG